MKHTLKITVILVAVFFLAQIVGLLIINQYIDHKKTEETGKVEWENLPYEIERPVVEESTSYWYIIIAILIGTSLALLIIKFNKINLWKLWFFISVWICLTIALAAFISQIFALIISFFLAFFKSFKPQILIHNITELFVYGGLAAIFVPIMNVFAVSMLLILISIYDAYAVWKSKHMVKLAKFTSQSKVFAGLFIPYSLKHAKEGISNKVKAKIVKTKAKNAILGGGDIGFPLMFAGVVMKSIMLQELVLVGFLKTLIIPLIVTIALFVLLIKAEKNKFYPAMPFLSAGCFLGYAIILFL